jgi:dienelactone hydrolase
VKGGAFGRSVAARMVRTRAAAGLVGLALITACAAGTTASSAGSTPSVGRPTDRSSQPVGATIPPDIVSRRPFPVTRETRTFVDRNRPTAAGHPGLGPPGSLPAATDERILVTEIYRPAGPGPFPLIMFSHGLSGHPNKFTELLGAWATAGYIVVAPAFPLTNSTVPGNSGNAFDLWDQPEDISFVLDQVLAASRTAGDSLDAKVDTARLGVAGLSLGGATTYGLVYNDCCRDNRFIAAEVLSGALLPLPHDYDLSRSIPILIMHGDHDLSLAYSGAVDAFARAAGPKVFVTLIGGSHAPPFEDDKTPYDATVDATTTDFWDVFLAGDASRRAALTTDSHVEGLTSVLGA